MQYVIDLQQNVVLSLVHKLSGILEAMDICHIAKYPNSHSTEYIIFLYYLLLVAE